MDKVLIKINGTELMTDPGSTVLETCRANQVEIPTLCHHPALKNIGACRMCLVEIENAPALQPACTFPVTEGMSILTESPRVKYMRRFVLEMLFSERNHYCMFCEMSSNCELQSLAYQNGLTNWAYPAPNPKLGVDASRKYFMLDHNRCILCRRCVRACNEVVANHTIGVKMRGARTMIIADMDVPFGDSTCVSCGTCLQVCPTGALVDRKSAYMGKLDQVSNTKSTCTFCGLGCGIQVITRDRSVLRVEGDWETENAGVLCVEGRFKPLHEARTRITEPMIRRNESLVPATWDEALAKVASALRGAGTRGAMGWISPRLLDGPMDAAVHLLCEAVPGEVTLLDAPTAPGTSRMGGAIDDIDGTSAILVAGTDPMLEQPVLGYRIRRAVDEGVPLYCITDSPDNQTARYATKVFPLKHWKEAVAAVRDAEKVFVAYGMNAYFDLGEEFGSRNGAIRFLPVSAVTNVAGAMRLGIKRSRKDPEPTVSYLLTGDSVPSNGELARMRLARFMVYHGPYLNAAAESADVVLPAPVWYERSGSFHATDGKLRPVNAALPPPDTIRTEEEVLTKLAAMIQGVPATPAAAASHSIGREN